MIVAVTPTPVHQLPRLAAAIGLAELWVKREDLTGLAGGGNKARKLVNFVADALAAGAKRLVTGGGPQSNHARMTAAAAAMHGLGCDLLLRRPADPSDVSGNLLLDRLLGADVHWVDAASFDELNAAIAEFPGAYPIPIGGSSLPGSRAYLAVAGELHTQVEADLVVTATGSGGTQAGLAAGYGDHGRALGVNVGAQDDIEEFVTALAADTARAEGRPEPRGTAQLDHDQVGDGYGIPTDACWEALRLTARAEGLVLDPVYTAKAMAALIARVRDGRIARDTRVVFVHTGGLPGLLSTQYSTLAATH